MRKILDRKVLFIIVIMMFCCGIPLTTVAINYFEHYVMINNLHALLCEKLKPGMSVSQVSEILNKTGSVIIREANVNSRYGHYSILFTDKKEQDLYGGWTELMFVEGKYSRAYIEGFELESVETICDFSQTTEPPSATLKP